MINIINSQTNVRNKTEIESLNNKEEKQIKNKEVKEEMKEIQQPEVIDKKTIENIENYIELMNIRLNNVLLEANKESLILYKKILNSLSNEISNLDYLKITNLLNDCDIKAGSTNGFVLTIENENILEELYLEYKEIEKIFSEKAKKNLKVSIIKESFWSNNREEYVRKIKANELVFIDESDIIKELEKKNPSNGFEDLLEIGD